MDKGIMLTQARINAMTFSGLWSGKTILDSIDRALKHYPDQVVLTDHNSMTGRTTTLSYRHLERCSRRIAAALVKAGILPGDIVAFQLPNWWEFAAIHIGCARIGAISNPLMPVFRERELKFMLSFAETKALFIPRKFRGFDYPQMIESLRPELPTLEQVFVLGGEGDNSFEQQILDRRWEDEIDCTAVFTERSLHPNEVAEVCYTSGTTGQPKGVMHTYNTLIACLGPAIDSLKLSSDTVVLMPSPLAHQTGFLYGMLLPITLGARTVFQDIWNAEKALQIIHEEEVTLTMGSTPFVADLSSSDAITRYPPESLEIFICAGAPIPRVLVQTASQRLRTHIISGWGMSENGLVTSTLVLDPPQKVFETDGTACPGMEVRVVDETGQSVNPGIAGQLQTRGAANFVGYLKRPEAYDVDAEGWFNTGDIATLDNDGYIRITGRDKDIIIRGGENVPVVEIEELLYRHEAVADAAIVAMPDPRLGERGCAFVTLKPHQTLSLETMKAYFAKCRLAKNYWPEHLEILSEMPRTASGKIQKFKLREMAATLRDH